MTSALPRLTSFTDYLDLYARARPDADAVWHAGTLLSYRALAEQVDAMAGSLAAAGLRAGDRVAVLMGNGMAWPELLFGLSARGAVCVSTSSRRAKSPPAPAPPS